MRTTSSAPAQSRERLRILEAARELSLKGEYRAGVEMVEGLLQDSPSDIEAKRLKGNILELAALHRVQYEARKLLRSSQFLQARRCYEDILQADPNNTLAMIDLADHFKNLAAFEQAISYYDSALAVLRSGVYRLDWKDEIRTVYDGKIEIAQTQRRPGLVEGLRAECEEMLKSRGRVTRKRTSRVRD